MLANYSDLYVHRRLQIITPRGVHVSGISGHPEMPQLMRGLLYATALLVT